MKKSMVKPTLKLDNADCDVEKQFDQSKLAFIHVVESLLLDVANVGDILEITEAVTGVSPNQDAEPKQDSEGHAQ